MDKLIKEKIMRYNQEDLELVQDFTDSLPESPIISEITTEIETRLEEVINGNNSKEKILADAIDIFGHRPQIDMTVEEAGEFLQALMKVTRHGATQETIKNLAEEIVDFKLMIGQIIMIYNIPEKLLSFFEKEKLNRLEKKLKICYGCENRCEFIENPGEDSCCNCIRIDFMKRCDLCKECSLPI